PHVVCARTLRCLLQNHCPVVKEKFCPTFWGFGGRLQTILRVLLVSKPSVFFRKEIILTSDGGQISLDWADNDKSFLFPDAETRPTVLLLPGLTGNSQQSYILHLVTQACKDGYRMTLLNYLASSGYSSNVRAAVVFSTPWNVFQSTLSLEEPLNYFLFNRNLVRGLRSTVKRYRQVIGKFVDVDYVLQARSIRDFDERYTSVVFGFASCDEYYRQACPDYKLVDIRTPVLCLNAADDPFSPMHAIPVIQVSHNPYVALLITNHGGHIGFLEGAFPRHQRYMDCVFSQFAGAILQHGDELRCLEQNSPHHMKEAK
ncbi:protein ABHD1, partial [Bombina bombina]|uniref:protein ABHD1 n=1 Tax=Bombina bombina TaxID=8345 RepID=UPI00235B10DD